MEKINWLAERHKIFIPKVDSLIYKRRQEDIARHQGGCLEVNAESEHYKLMRTDNEYSTTGFKWMRRMGKKIESMPLFWADQ